jgi:hypothetical protein
MYIHSVGNEMTSCVLWANKHVESVKLAQSVNMQKQLRHVVGAVKRIAAGQMLKKLT